jgi:hypothetical protein
LTYVPNPDKPGELSTLRLAVDDLILCRRAGGGWDLAKLDQWLQRYPLELSEAVNTLDEVLDEHYPPTETGVSA